MLLTSKKQTFGVKRDRNKIKSISLFKPPTFFQNLYNPPQCTFHLTARRGMQFEGTYMKTKGSFPIEKATKLGKQSKVVMPPPPQLQRNGMESGCLDSRLLCLPVAHPRLPQNAPWSGQWLTLITRILRFWKPQWPNLPQLDGVQIQLLIN